MSKRSDVQKFKGLNGPNVQMPKDGSLDTDPLTAICEGRCPKTNLDIWTSIWLHMRFDPSVTLAAFITRKQPA